MPVRRPIRRTGDAAAVVQLFDPTGPNEREIRLDDLGVCREPPFDVVFGEDTVVQPDFLFVSGDRSEKRALYARAGVSLFVVVDPGERLVETFELDEHGEYVYRGGAGGDETLTIGCSPDLEKVWPPSTSE